MDSARQSDKIWRIDLQDDNESCHPVGQPDSMTISYLVTLVLATLDAIQLMTRGFNLQLRT